MNNFRLKYLLFPGICLLLLSGCTTWAEISTHRRHTSATANRLQRSCRKIPKNPNDWKVAQPQDAMLHGKMVGNLQRSGIKFARGPSSTSTTKTSNNPLKTSWRPARFVAQARAQLYPTLSVGPTYNIRIPPGNLKEHHRHYRRVGQHVEQGFHAQTSELATLPFSASWAAPIFGAESATSFMNSSTTPS